MSHKYTEIMFTDTVKRVQVEQNSRDSYVGMEQGVDVNYVFSQREADFIEARDSFYMASVTETDWPYVQHRGGPEGFMKVLDGTTLGFADFSGNSQYISTGNFRNNDRVSLFFMDYPSRTRMKVIGRVSVVADDDWETLADLEVDSYRARVERGFIIKVEAFDWNCPQHITPRYTDAYIQKLMAPLEQQNKDLKQALSQSSPRASAERLAVAALGDGPLELVVSGIRQLSPRIRAYELRSPVGEDLAEFCAGAHLRIPVQLDNGEVQERHYSICSNPARRDMYEIAVLREDEGKGGSLSIHQHLMLGQRLNCSPAENYFELHHDNRPAVLIAAGIGITPIKPMAQSLKSRGVGLSLHYAGRSNSDMAFCDRLQRELTKHMHIYSAAENQRMSLVDILSNSPADAVFYACGPNRLIDDLVEVAQQLGIPEERIHFERFSASVQLEAKPVIVHLQRSDIQIEVGAQQSILDAMLNAGVNAPYSCKTGQCKSCVVRVLDGEAQHLDSALSDAEKDNYKLMCPCVSRANSESITLDI